MYIFVLQKKNKTETETEFIEKVRSVTCECSDSVRRGGNYNLFKF